MLSVVKKDGTYAWRENQVILWLLNKAQLHLSTVLNMEFDDRDKSEFVKLTGARLDHWSKLPYVSEFEVILTKEAVKMQDGLGAVPDC